MVSSLSTVSLLLLASGVSAAVEPIVVKGTKFYYENGTQFFFKGIAYQQGVGAGGAADTSTTYSDPLANETLCKRDIPYLQELGTNVIRTYTIDPTADHSGCMELLQDAGIYVISDLSDPTESIDSSDPTWDTELYARYTSVVDALAQYDNVIGFFAGNEVSDMPNNTDASAYVKAAVRDTKAYINQTASRWMGVGYAADDDQYIRYDAAWYFNCGEQEDAVDFWGYNIYEWCGESTFVASGYAAVVDFFKNYSVPVFFAEYGCNVVSGGAAGRIWEETTALYSDNMTGVISGGIVYEYFEATNDYGLVSIVDGEVSTMADYDTLKTRIASADPSSTSSAAYTPTNSPQPCPAVAGNWSASNNLPPTPDSSLCDCKYASLSCVPDSGLSVATIGDLMGEVCGYPGSPCVDVVGNGTTGVYGTYSMCNSTVRLAIAIDTYYKAQGSKSSACNFDNQAKVVSPAKAGTSCSSALASASSAAASESSASGSPTSTSSSSFAVPGRVVDGWFGAGEMAVGMYVVFSAAVGAGMMLL